MTQRRPRKISFDLPITINLYPHGHSRDKGRAWEIIDDLDEKDVENALLAVFDQYSDGREPLPVELIRRELQSLVTDPVRDKPRRSGRGRIRAGHARFACEVSGAAMPPAAGTHRSSKP